MGLGTGFIGLCLAMDNVGQMREKPMMVTLSATGNEFPSLFVHRIFAVYGVEYEPGEVEFVQDKECHAEYRVRLSHNTPIEEMSAPAYGRRNAEVDFLDRKDKR